MSVQVVAQPPLLELVDEDEDEVLEDVLDVDELLLDVELVDEDELLDDELLLDPPPHSSG